MTAVALLPGDILLTRSESAIGAIIRFGETVKYHGWRAALTRAAGAAVGRPVPADPSDPAHWNHAAVFIGRGQVVEALAAGLTVSPAGKYPAGSFTVLRLADLLPDVSAASRARVVMFARAEQARHDAYGWCSIASIVVQLLTPVRLDLSWDGALICSAFAARCLEHAGFVLPTLSALTTMPADLAALIPSTPTLGAAA